MMPFSYCEQNHACREWGWPEDDYHQELVISTLKLFFIQTGYVWKIRNVQEANLLPEHHGIGVRIDDFKPCRQYSGVLEKQYESVAVKGDRAVEKSMKECKKDAAASLKGKPVEYRKRKRKRRRRVFSAGRKRRRKRIRLVWKEN